MSSQPVVVRKVAETDDILLVEEITPHRNVAVAQSNDTILAAQSRVSSAQPVTGMYASDFTVSSDTEPVARDASNTVTGKVQAVASDTTAAARDASNNVSKKVQGFASDTKVAARDASHTVTGKVQGLTVSAKNVANSAAQTLSDTLHYGRDKAVENLKVVQENAAILAQRAKEHAVAASSSAYHASRDATVQGLTVVGHHAAGATSGVVEGIQDTMGVERINKPATGSATIDDAANHTERGAATKDYTKSTTMSALKVVGGYVSHGIEVTKHAVGGASQGVYEGLGGVPYKNRPVLQEGDKSTTEAARQAEEQAQYHMQHPVGKQAHDVAKGVLDTAATYVNHGLNVTKETAGGVLQGITEHIKKAPDGQATGTVGSTSASTVSPGSATDGSVCREESKKQTVAAIETGAQKMGDSADYLKEKVNTAFSSTPAPPTSPFQSERGYTSSDTSVFGNTQASNTIPFQSEKGYTGSDTSVFGNTQAANTIPFQSEKGYSGFGDSAFIRTRATSTIPIQSEKVYTTATGSSNFNSAPLQNEKVVAAVTGTPEAYAGPANPIAGEPVPVFVKTVAHE